MGNRTYTTKTITLAPINITANWGVLTSKTPVYFAEGESVTVTFKDSAFTQYHVNGVTDTATYIDITGKTLSGDTITLVLTATTDITGGSSIQINWPA